MARVQQALTGAVPATCYLAALAGMAIALPHTESGFWLYAVGAIGASLALGVATPRLWVLVIPAAISALACALAFGLLASGVPSYDNDPMLALYILAFPACVLVVLGAPMLLGVLIGRSLERDSDPEDGEGPTPREWSNGDR